MDKAAQSQPGTDAGPNSPRSPEDIVGHKTLRSADGHLYHEPLKRGEAEEMLAAADAARDKRAADMPTEKDAIEAMWRAFQRLRELDWCEAIYCPKDGSSFDAIEPGSTGIFRTHYSGEWPKGSWWAEDGGDLWPAHPILYRRTEEERQRWASLRGRLVPDQSADAVGDAAISAPEAPKSLLSNEVGK